MHTPPHTYTPATRAAIAKGPLTRQLLDKRLETAACNGIDPVDAFTLAEEAHLLAVRETMGDVAFADVLDAFDAVG